MSEKIHLLINDVRNNFTSLSERFLSEKSKNESLSVENVDLKNHMERLINENNALKAEVDELRKHRNELNEEFRSQSSQTTMVSEEKIDELVKEIDYCIGQLKK